MNQILKPFSNKEVKPGFISGFINDELVYEIVMEYIGRDKKLYGIIYDSNTDQEDPIQLLSDAIYVEGADIYEVCDDSENDLHIMIYSHDDIVVAFMIRKNWNVAFWTE